ncbi:MAG: hypothetical protein JRH20_29960, partial [Deltaproteobacteria bacterium]|nr:hypothetical protein [Deltaproteobacteria bacterium]
YRGYRELDRESDELLVAVHVPALPSGTLERFRKVGTRRAQAISKVVGACRLALDEKGTISHAALGFGSVGPVTMALDELASWLIGKEPTPEIGERAAQLASEAVQPMDDIRSTADYRRHVVGRIVKAWIVELATPNR